MKGKSGCPKQKKAKQTTQSETEQAETGEPPEFPKPQFENHCFGGWAGGAVAWKPSGRGPDEGEDQGQR